MIRAADGKSPAAPLFLGRINQFDIEASYPAVRILDGPFRSRSEIESFCDAIPIGSVKNLPSSEYERTLIGV